MRIVAIILALFLAMPAQAQGLFSMPVHGNWCGINHSGGLWASLPPIDPLDAACLRHDICTAQRGRLNCGCDISFMQELRATRWSNPAIAEKARAIYDAIAMMPCDAPDGQAIKVAMCMSDWSEGVLSGRESPIDIFRRWSLLGADIADRGGLGNR